MQAETQLDRDMDRRNRAFLDIERVEDQQVALGLLQPVAYLHDPAIAFGSVLGTGNKAGFLQA